jgi:hypothetical protein
MSPTKSLAPIPDAAEVPSEIAVGEHWDSAALAALIHSKSSSGRTPAFLFLGRHEAALLKDHLAAAFGPEVVPSLKGTYYMGLEVIELDTERYLRTAGEKAVRTPHILRPKRWSELERDSVWRLSLDL